MLIQPTLDLLRELRLTGMAEALEQQLGMPDIGELAFEDRISRLLDELTLARGDGSYPKLIQRLARTWLLILDDWGLATLSGQARHDLLEVLDDRYARRGTILASQVPVEHWHDLVDDASHYASMPCWTERSAAGRCGHLSTRAHTGSSSRGSS